MMKFVRRFKDLGIEGTTARWYNNNTRKHRLDEMRGYAKEVAAHLHEGDRVLEIAPGPGYLAIELAKMEKYSITGMDISQDFVDIARENARQEHVNVEFLQGNASEIPLPDATFDFIVCSAAFKNFKEPLKALNEMFRVLRPGATALVIDMNANASNQQINALTESMGVKGIEALFMKLTFKYFLRKGAYTRNGFKNLISKTPFARHDIRGEGIVFYVYLQKQNSVHEDTGFGAGN